MSWLLRILGLLVVVGAVAGGAYYGGLIQEPTVGLEDHGDWGDVSDERTEIITTVWVNNPNQVGISLGGNVRASYQLYLNDINLAQGEKEGITIDSGNNTVDFTTELNNQQLPAWWVAFIQNNETIQMRAGPSATVRAGPFTVSPELPEENRTLLGNETPVIGALSAVASQSEGRYTENVSAETFQDRFDQDLPETELTNEGYEIGYILQEGWATWGEVDQETTEVDFHFLIHNPSEELCMPAEPDNVGVSVDMNDVELFQAQAEDTSLQNPGEFSSGDDAVCARALDRPVLAPQETREVVYTVEMDNDKIDEWFTSHVEQTEQTEVRAELQFVFSYNGTTFRLPEDSPAGYTCRFQTDILVDDQDTATTCLQPESVPGVETDDAQQEDDETQDDDETPTATETATDTATPTPAPPTAQIAANQTTGQAPLTVSFDASGSTDPNGDIEGYVWRFKDGSPPQEGQNVTHTFRTAGEYEVELTVIDSQGNRDTTTITVTVELRG